MKLEFLPHTADIKMRVEAKTLEELFKVAMRGMAEILKEGRCNERHNWPLEANISITSKDRTCLLIDFLSEVLSLSCSEKAIYCQLQITTLGAKKMEATIFGTAIDDLDEEIKAVTYHEAKLEKNNNGLWETFVIFDI